MKQLVILSGKGGTGKTSLSASFAHLASQSPHTIHPLFIDADVDAANLALLIDAHPQETHPFYGAQIAHIEPSACTACGTCQTLCRFNAITHSQGAFAVDPLACEGCQVCAHHCPTNAITMQDNLSGHWYHSQSNYGTFFHADLIPGQENSGKLISEIKAQAKKHTKQSNHNFILIDGPPGIGCPVIAAISGATLALIVVEPSASGIHDMHRILQTTQHFRVPAHIIINKADLNPEKTQEIKAYCQTHQLNILGEIPYDPAVTQAMQQNQPITTQAPTSPTTKSIQHTWDQIKKQLVR